MVELFKAQFSKAVNPCADSLQQPSKKTLPSSKPLIRVPQVSHQEQHTRALRGAVFLNCSCVLLEVAASQTQKPSVLTCHCISFRVVFLP